VLDDVSFDLAAGRLNGLWEERRALGSMVMMRIVARTVRPDAGSVRFEGHDLFSRRGRRKPEIAFVFPPPALCFDVLDLVAGAAVERSRGWRGAKFDALAALEWAGVRELAGRDLCTLSSSEKLLVTLACGVASRPKLLVVKRPAEFFDDARGEFLERLSAYAASSGTAVLIPVTDQSDLRHCDDRMLLQQGRMTGPSSRPGFPLLTVVGDR